MLAKDDYIIELLLREGFLQQQSVVSAQQGAKKNGRSVIEELIQQGVITQLNVLHVLASDTGRELREEVGFVPDRVVQLVPRQIAYRYHVMPIHLEGNLLTIAIGDPYDFDSMDTVPDLAG